MLALAGTAQPAGRAAFYFQAAQRAERRGDTLNAYLLYARAASLDPANRQYAFEKSALQAKVALGAETKLDAEPGSRQTFAVPTGDLTPSEITETREAVEPPRLKPAAGKKTFDLRGDARTVIEQVVSAYGIQPVFEADYQGPPAFTFRVTDALLEDALRALETASNSFFVPVNQNLVLVVRDTPQRRADTSPAMSIAIPIPERLTVQEAQELVTAVQQTMEIRRVSVDPGRHMVYMRDQAAKIAAARNLFTELSRARAQVAVEIEFLSTSRSSSLSYGLTTQTSMPVVNFGSFLNNVGSAVAGFTKFLTFGGGATFLGMGIADANLLATISRSSAESLLRTEVVTADGQAASLHVGDKYPIIVNGYYGDTSGTGQVYTPPPTVQFQDLGLVLKLTPTVHEAGEVTLDIETEYSTLGALGANNIPSISHRKYQGKVRLGSGEWAVIAGLVRANMGNTRSGFPVLGWLFGKNTVDQDSSQTLIVLKPRLVNLPPWENLSPPLWVGTETKPLTLY